MQKITSANELKNAIRQLETDQQKQVELLKNQINLIAASLDPMNLLTIAVKKILSSPVVILIGIEKIKLVVYQLIDRIFRDKQTAADQK